MSKKVRDIETGDLVQGYYMVKDYRLGKTKTGNEYVFIDLQDNSGAFKVKVWELSDAMVKILPTSRGHFFEVKGIMGEYNGQPEIVDLHDLEYITREGLEQEQIAIDYSEYEETAPVPVKESEGYILNIIRTKITNKVLSDIVRKVYNKYYRDMRYYPAASGIHHAYKSGLIYHTYGMLSMAENVVNHYKSKGVPINESLLYSGVILHDMGKIVEYDYDGTIAEVNKVGSLLGHIYIMASEVERIGMELGYDKKTHDELLLLIHLILSHHGKKEWGSPVAPSSVEAHILHQLDMMDASMDILRKEVGNVKDNEFTDKLYGLNNQYMYKHNIEENQEIE